MILDLQVFGHLLRANSSDSKRPLIRSSLDILTPTLAKKLQQTSDGEVLWAKNMRRILVEEASGIQQMHNIWQLVIRHAEIFYPIRQVDPKKQSKINQRNETGQVSLSMQYVFGVGVHYIQRERNNKDCAISPVFLLDMVSSAYRLFLGINFKRIESKTFGV